MNIIKKFHTQLQMSSLTELVNLGLSAFAQLGYICCSRAWSCTHYSAFLQFLQIGGCATRIYCVTVGKVQQDQALVKQN